jgi:hypothetical protein
MEGERELTTGLLSKTASFRLIVSGQVGVAEIERLIKKLEIDKEILAEDKPNGEQIGLNLKMTRPPTEAALVAGEGLSCCVGVRQFGAHMTVGLLVIADAASQAGDRSN